MSTCPTNTLTDCDCETSESGHTAEYALIPVHYAPSDNCKPTDCGCPESVPFWTLTAAKTFVMPSVGSTATLEVCDADQFAVGQWIKHPLGKLRITKVDGYCLDVVNGCPSGAAVLGNEAPGSTQAGAVAIWITDYDCAESSYCAELLDCLDASTAIKLTSSPVADETGVNDYHLFGGKIDDACGSGEDNESIIHKLESITSDGQTLNFKLLPALPAENTDPTYGVIFKEIDLCDASKGVALYKESNPANPGVYVNCGGAKAFVEVPADFNAKSYILRPNVTTGCPEWAEDSGNIYHGCFSGFYTTAATDHVDIVSSWTTEINDIGFIVTGTAVEVPTDGTYKVTLSTGIANNGGTNAGNVYFGFYVNGVLSGNYRTVGNVSPNNAGNGSVLTVLSLSAGDSISIKGRILSSPALTPQGALRTLDPCITIEKK